MDRDRLKEVHQTDLTESRVNEDFVDWLKSKGPSWLLVILIAVCVFLGVTRFKQYRAEKQSNAWRAFFEARLPESYEDVARDFEGVGRMAVLARLQAAEELLAALQRGAKLGATPNFPQGDTGAPTDPFAPEDRLDEEDREKYLARADGLYQQVADADDGGRGMTLLVVNALNGRAAIAECRADAATAKTLYEQAAARAEAYYPGMAKHARMRADSVEEYARVAVIPSQRDISRLAGPRSDRRPVTIDESLREMLLPDESGG